MVALKAGREIDRQFSYQVADDWASGALVRLLREFGGPALPVHLVGSSARHMPRSVRAFLDHAAPALDALRVIHRWRAIGCVSFVFDLPVCARHDPTRCDRAVRSGVAARKALGRTP